MRSRGSQPAGDFRWGWLSGGGDAGERIGLGSVLGMREVARSRRVSRLRAMVARGRRSEAGVPCGGGARRALRAGGPRADRRSAVQAGAPFRRSGGWWLLRSRDVGERGDVTPPAGGGLCRLKPAFQAGGAIGRGARRGLRAGGPRAGLKTGGPRRHAIMEAGMVRAGALPWRFGGLWFLRSRDLVEQTYATPPAFGGLCRLKPAFQAGGAVRGRSGTRFAGLRPACRLKPAFQAGGAVPAWRASGRWAA